YLGSMGAILVSDAHLHLMSVHDREVLAEYLGTLMADVLNRKRHLSVPEHVESLQNIVGMLASVWSGETVYSVLHGAAVQAHGNIRAQDPTVYDLDVPTVLPDNNDPTAQRAHDHMDQLVWGGGNGQATPIQDASGNQ